MPQQEHPDPGTRAFDIYSAAIDAKIIAAGGKDWNSLSKAELTFVLAHRLALEITNGGIEKFIINPAGNHWMQTLDALNTVGASELLKIMERVSLIFPNGLPSADQMERCEEYERTGKSGEDFVRRLDDQYFKLQVESASNDLYELLAAFAMEQTK